MDFTALLVGLAPIFCESMAEMIRNTGQFNRQISNLQTDIADLKAMRDDLKNQIEQDELEGRTCTNHAREWLNAVQAAETKTSSIMDKIARTRRRRYLGCFRTSCCADCKLSKKVLAMLKNIGELRERASNINVDGGVRHEPSKEIPSRPAIGLTTIMEQIWQFLAEEETGIIGIYGTGGVGKTTLLQSVNNELINKSHLYDVVIWVTVSRDFVDCKIQHTVGTRLGLSWEERESGEQRASRIYRAMKRKRFLLLLDDVWEEIDFEKIGIPRPNKENKCKVIFTARSTALCSAMCAQRKLKVEFLDQEKSWELFCDKVGRRDFLESPSIHPLAKSIVRKCGGLPLALITVGRAMAYRETEEEWMHAIEALNRSPTEVRGMKEVFALLRFSYDNLENDLLRACFLYCALFPEDHSVETEQLVKYWIGEGFLTSSRGVNATYKGYAVLGDLKAACLLETGEEKTQVKMHDVLRSFALWIASEQGFEKELILVEPSMGLTEAPEAESWRQALVISLLDNRIQILPSNPICPDLTTLMLQWNSSLKIIPTEFFEHMPVLRVLDLSFTGLSEIPSSIECLVELCHLAMSGTKISALPEELGNLKKLKYLDLQRTQFLQTIPRNAIRGLNKLEVLNLYYSYAGWGLQSSEPDEEELGFSDLEDLKNLTTLGITLLSLESLKMLHEFGTLHNHIQYVYIEQCNSLLYLDFPSNSNHGRRLRRLSINSCHNLEYLLVPIEAGNDWLPSLEVLTLHSLHNLTTVWRNSVSQDCLRNLRYVNIWHCPKLKNVSWVLRLPKLEVIYLFYCRELEEVISGEESHLVEDPASFPSLRTLSMRDLPELRSILPSQFSFPKLETVAIIDCTKLKKLTFLAKMQTKLPTVYGNKKWWDGLEWDGTNVELSCLPRFVPSG